MIKVEIHNCLYKTIDSAELKRACKEARITQEQLANKMDNWGWSIGKVHRYISGKDRCHFHPDEMQQLLDVLGATSI